MRRNLQVLRKSAAGGGVAACHPPESQRRRKGIGLLQVCGSRCEFGVHLRLHVGFLAWLCYVTA